ncbi:unnamed protein product, partial [Callosobruchus maculatus]
PALRCPACLGSPSCSEIAAALTRDAPAIVICSKTAVGAFRLEDVARFPTVVATTCCICPPFSCFVVYSAFLLFWCSTR